ncbi:OmpA family protein [Algoriphagus sp. AGSA1]|uniref:OmpA family protein n=1 Tax=Algoriphagus sp. AGSA1 TaxID=2907213 RepID=UPI001F30503F|nr:OmpA family protein [Algoriphagus sp. AGSA1]MCE7053725.1 OmpA family protein [Algoriphagus sp. AGSA1]
MRIPSVGDSSNGNIDFNASRDDTSLLLITDHYQFTAKKPKIIQERLKLNNPYEAVELFHNGAIGESDLYDKSGAVIANPHFCLGCEDIADCLISRDQQDSAETHLQPFALNSTVILNHFKVLDKGRRLPESDYVYLGVLTQFLLENPDVNLDLKHHADSRHSHYFNQRVSERHAKAVVAHLIENGIKPERINSVSYGKSYPLVDCPATCELDGYTINTRVEAVFFKGDFNYRPYEYPRFDVKRYGLVDHASKVTVLGTLSSDSSRNSVSQENGYGRELFPDTAQYLVHNPQYYLVAGSFNDLESAYELANYLRGHYTLNVYILPPDANRGDFLVAINRHAELGDAMEELRKKSTPFKLWIYYG